MWTAVQSAIEREGGIPKGEELGAENVGLESAASGKSSAGTGQGQSLR